MALVALAATLAMGYAIFSGPRMRTQENIRAYEAAFPPIPPNTVAVMAASGPAVRLSDEEMLAAGKTYYTYYCAFCHGDDGSGNGPVGESYVPRPDDLRTQRIKAMSQEQLLSAMLHGVGHEPVMERVVWPAYRRPLVLYVQRLNPQALSSGDSAPSAAKEGAGEGAGRTSGAAGR